MEVFGMGCRGCLTRVVVMGLIFLLGVAGVVTCMTFIYPREEMAVLEIEGGLVEVDAGRGWQEASSGMQLKEGSAVRTGSDGEAKVVFRGDSAASLARGTEIVLHKLTDEGGASVWLEVREGQTWHYVSPVSGMEAYVVETPVGIFESPTGRFAVDVRQDKVRVVNTQGYVNSLALRISPRTPGPIPLPPQPDPPKLPPPEPARPVTIQLPDLERHRLEAIGFGTSNNVIIVPVQYTLGPQLQAGLRSQLQSQLKQIQRQLQIQQAFREFLQQDMWDIRVAFGAEMGAPWPWPLEIISLNISLKLNGYKVEPGQVRNPKSIVAPGAWASVTRPPHFEEGQPPRDYVERWAKENRVVLDWDGMQFMGVPPDEPLDVEIVAMTLTGEQRAASFIVERREELKRKYAFLIERAKSMAPPFLGRPVTDADVDAFIDSYLQGKVDIQQIIRDWRLPSEVLRLLPDELRREPVKKRMLRQMIE